MPPKVEAPQSDGEEAELLRGWFGKFPRCQRAALAASKRPLARDIFGRILIDKPVALRGRIALARAGVPAIEIVDDNGKQIDLARWQWDLVLCGGQRVDVLFPKDKYPEYFARPSRVESILERFPSNVVVSGKLTRFPIDASHYSIQDAKVCRLETP